MISQEGFDYLQQMDILQRRYANFLVWKNNQDFKSIIDLIDIEGNSILRQSTNIFISQSQMMLMIMNIFVFLYFVSILYFLDETRSLVKICCCAAPILI